MHGEQIISNTPIGQVPIPDGDWEHVLSAIQELVPGATFNRWFKPLSAVRSTEGEVVIMADDEFDALFIEKNFSDLIRHQLEETVGDPVRLRITHTTGPSDPAPRDTPSLSAKPAGQGLAPRPVCGPMVPTGGSLAAKEPRSGAEVQEKGLHLESNEPTLTERIIASGLKHQYSFDGFIVGSCNEFAYAAAMAVQEKPGKAYNPLFLYGSVGLGKTHLLNAIGIELLRRAPTLRVKYLTAEAFMNELIEHLQAKNMRAFRARYRDQLDILLIDDIQFIAGKEATQQEFFHTFNTLHQSGAQIVITSDRYPHEIPDLEERLRSRFQWGLIADLQAPSIETRMAILKKKALSIDLPLPDEVALYMAEHIRSNVRELEGALLRLHAFVGFNKRSLDLNLAKNLLRQFLQDRQRSVSVESIQKAICAYYNIKVTDLKGKSRQRTISLPRQVAIYLSKKYTGLSFPQLGEKFGGRDHTTILASYHKVVDQIESDRSLRAVIVRFEKQLGLQ